MTEQPAEIDPYILDSVVHVRDRFGAAGLRQLIAEADRELAEAEAALAELRESVAGEEGDTPPDGPR